MVNSCDSIDEIITSAIKDAADKCIPKSKERLDRNNNFPKDILQVLDTRNFWGVAFRSTRSELFAKKYREFQSLANEKMRHSS